MLPITGEAAGERMAKTSISARIDAPAEKVWELLGAFDGLPRISDVVATSRLEEGGRVRRLTQRAGGELVERLVYFDDKARTFTYQILESAGVDLPYKLPSYKGTIRVRDEVPGKTSICEILGEYEPADGREEEAAEETRAFYEGCMNGLRKVLGV